MGTERGKVGAAVGVEEGREPCPDEALLVDAELHGAGKVRLPYRPRLVEREVPDRGEVVEVGEPVPQPLGLTPRPHQLLVLQLHLALVHLQLVDQGERVLVRERPVRPGRLCPQGFLGLPPEAHRAGGPVFAGGAAPGSSAAGTSSAGTGSEFSFMHNSRYNLTLHPPRANIMVLKRAPRLLTRPAG